MICPRCSIQLKVPPGAERTGFRCGNCNAALQLFNGTTATEKTVPTMGQHDQKHTEAAMHRQSELEVDQVQASTYALNQSVNTKSVKVFQTQDTITVAQSPVGRTSLRKTHSKQKAESGGKSGNGIKKKFSRNRRPDTSWIRKQAR